MASLTTEQLRTAFIEPIRFALLLDDQFPVYPGSTEEAPAAGPDFERAKGLFSFCRSKGWLCDVENGVDVPNRFERAKHLHQTDLLVLDYHLAPGDETDASDALDIIQRLSQTDHFNLVIVYTSAEIGPVTRDVAWALGASGWAPTESAAAREKLEEFENAELDTLRGALTEDLLNNWLLGKAPAGKPMSALRSALNDMGVGDFALQNAIAALLAQESVAGRLPKRALDRRPGDHQIEASFDTRSVRWVTYGNVFVALVSKEQAPDTLESRLIDALAAWNPSPLLLMMLHARASLERAATIADRATLETPLRQAGWLLGALLSKTDQDKRAYVRQLYGRLYDKLTQTIVPAVEEFGLSLIGDGGGEPPHKHAAALARGGEIDPTLVYHALNEYACSDLCPDGPMTTGIVFRGKRHADSALEYWICTSPACDLVPGQNMKGWDKDLKPLRPITAARLSPTSVVTQIGKLLKSATRARALFLTVAGEPMAFEVADDTTRLLELETLVLADEGVIKNGKLKANVGVIVAGALAWVSIDLEMVAKLRADYANRLLAESGQQRARIGVDFFNQPT
jgi:CheY-like chemotaxis protein